jgi:hypothetical protein
MARSVDLDGRRTLCVIVCNGVDPTAHRVGPHHLGVIRLQHIGHHPHVVHSRIEPQIVTVWIKDHRHSIMDGGSHRVRCRRQDRARFDPLSARVFPAIPQPCECKQRPVTDFKTVRLLRFARPLPLVKPVRWDEASTVGQRITERGLRRSRLTSGVNHHRCTRHILRPRWDESPTHQRQLPPWFFWVLANDGDGLGWCDVVAGIPLRLVRRRVEVLLDKLFPTRQSVASAHQEIIDRAVSGKVPQNECARFSAAFASSTISSCENNSVTCFRNRSPAAESSLRLLLAESMSM